jgi:alanine dehydrogenase
MAVVKKPIINTSFSYLPIEETLEIPRKKERMYIGIPCEDSFDEKRVALTPNAVNILVNNGHEVLVEHNAGANSFYADKDYSEAGAQICYDKKDVFKANIILKTAPISNEEIELCNMGQMIISPIHMPVLTPDSIKKLIEKKIIAIALGSIKDDAGNYPIVRAMSEIAGSYAIITASKYLSNTHNGKGILLGGVSGVPPAQVTIIGAGVVGLNAARTAIGLGATVKVFDNSIYKLMRLQNILKQHIFTSVIDTNILEKELLETDVLIGALKPKNGITPMVVSQHMVSQMKNGSVIIDVSIDCGGCVETSEITSHEKPVFTKYDVLHYCVPNMASAVARTASHSISNILMPILLEGGKHGGFENIIVNKNTLRNGVYLYKGICTNETIANKFNFKYTNINLLLGIQF